MRRSIALLPLVVALQAGAPPAQPQELHPPLSEAALRARLNAYAHDSMAGRKAGTAGNDRATEYIAREFSRMGLQPAGENGTWFQTVVLRTRRVPDSATTITLRGQALRVFEDYVPRLNGSGDVVLDGAPAVFGGVWGDTSKLISPAAAAGRIVVIALPPGQFAVVKTQLEQRFAAARGIAVANLDAMSPAVRELLGSAPPQAPGDSNAAARRLPAYLHIRSSLIAEIFGVPGGQVAPGAAGATFAGGYRFTTRTYTARNVVASLRGSDPSLNGTFVAIGSHNDHEGVGLAVDRDSLRAFNLEFRRLQLTSGGMPSPAQIAAIRVNMDSIRRVHPQPRRDSIYNGADDDASGTVAMLEIARAMAAAAPPLRSVLFVSHTAEEDGLVGSMYFTSNPTIPRDSIIAQLNLDMIGRGGPTDERAGGPGYLQIIGARRRSAQLGEVIETVSARGPHRWHLDYSLDAPGHPEQLFCRSDHFSYARLGIPVAFFSTGLHADYHQVTDEVEHLDVAKLARVSVLLRDVVLELANRREPLRGDKPAPDPGAPCVH